MTNLDFFKLQAKNLFRDFNTRVYDENEDMYIYNPRFFIDIDDILFNFDVDEESFTLMKAQHIIARLAGFNKWAELLKASEPILEIGKLLIEHRIDYQNAVPIMTNMVESVFVADWKSYEEEYLKNADDETKLTAFKKIFFESDNKRNKGFNIELDFNDAMQAQDMLSKIMKEKSLSSVKAIKSCIKQNNLIKILQTEWADIAVAHWGHAEGYSNFEKLDNPKVKITFTEKQMELISLVQKICKTNAGNAILYFMIFELETLGYHI